LEVPEFSWIWLALAYGLLFLIIYFLNRRKYENS